MARVDFSNARLEFITNSTQSGGGKKTYTTTYAMPLGVNTNNFYNATGTGGHSIASVGKAILVDTPTKWVCNYSGSFTESGTEIYLVCAYTQGYGNWAVAKITNISFSADDDFDFNIEITYSGD